MLSKLWFWIFDGAADSGHIGIFRVIHGVIRKREVLWFPEILDRGGSNIDNFNVFDLNIVNLLRKM